MQTFLPLPDYFESFMTLDRSRLGNQVYREGITLIGGGWPNHPASRMWRGYQYQLACYLAAGVDAMEARGWYRQGTIEKWRGFFEQFRKTLTPCDIPLWLGLEEFHASHRSNLLRKNSEWYGQFGWKESTDLPYIWPTQL